MSTLKGIAASAGIAIGRVYIYRPDDVVLDLESHDSISAEEKLKAISLANESVHHQVEALHARMEDKARARKPRSSPRIRCSWTTRRCRRPWNGMREKDTAPQQPYTAPMRTVPS